MIMMLGLEMATEKNKNETCNDFVILKKWNLRILKGWNSEHDFSLYTAQIAKKPSN